MYFIGAKDKVDKALVKQYASIKTANYDDAVKIDAEDMWNKINLFATGQKAQINLIQNLKQTS